MKKMNRPITTCACILAALAMLIWICAPVRADFLGTLNHDQDWQLNIDNTGSTGTSSLSVRFLNKRNDISDDVEITVPFGSRAGYVFPPPGRNITRIIIDVDPPNGATTMIVEVAQNRSLVTTCVGYTHLVANVE
jgi:hypothetical protein